MKSKSTKRSKSKNLWDPKKDITFKHLCSLAATVGLSVRREELKQGHGWKVMSGGCRLNSEKILFVDRKMPQDDQIAFLAARLSPVGASFTAEQLAPLSETVRMMLQPSLVAEAA